MRRAHEGRLVRQQEAHFLPRAHDGRCQQVAVCNDLRDERLAAALNIYVCMSDTCAQ